MAEYGYIRVSTKEQHTDRQHIALLEIGLKPENIFIDKQSGKNFDRPEYKRLLRKLKCGDTLYVAAIDRLGRNYEEILEQWRVLTKEKHINIVVLDMPLLDTRQKAQDLTGMFIADLVLYILSYVAQTERENTHKRQAEGIAAAQLKGVHFGRVSKEIPDNFDSVVLQWRNKEIPLTEALQQLSCGKTWFYKKIKERNL